MVVGTDCSGIDAPVWALRSLKVRCRHAFASDVNEHCRRIIRMNSPDVGVIYDDMTTRKVDDMERVHLYVVGFPCQPYSTINHRKTNRFVQSKVVKSMLKYIQTKRPLAVVLENVPALRTVHDGKAFKHIIQSIEACGYQTHHKVIDSKTMGVPQSRKRLYVVCLSTADQKGKFAWPKEVPLKRGCLDLIDHTHKLALPDIPRHLQRTLSDCGITAANRGIVDFSHLSFVHREFRKDGRTDRLTPEEMKKVLRTTVCPCIVHHIPGLYVSHLKRLATPEEHLALQGFPPKQFLYPKGYDAKIRAMCGNAMTVTVVAGVIQKCLHALQE